MSTEFGKGFEVHGCILVNPHFVLCGKIRRTGSMKACGRTRAQPLIGTFGGLEFSFARAERVSRIERFRKVFEPSSRIVFFGDPLQGQFPTQRHR